MSLVRAEYHGLLRRFAARSDQGRNDGGIGSQFRAPTHYDQGRRMTAGGVEKSEQCHKYFSAAHLLPKDVRFEHGAPNLLLAPGSI